MANSKSKINTKGVVVIVLFIIAIVVIMRMSKNNKPYSSQLSYGGSPAPTGGTSSSSGSGSIDNNTPLTRGMRGAPVLNLQRLINNILDARGMATISEDGIFGSQTEGALRSLTGRSSISFNEANALYGSL